ncbi:protein LLP homolog [Mytilus californianus]|uniref:protein LLP homolog n=1 Tax=Mytilus californianus TaxID=6549 RepID=UPI0022463A07|nr:protein LLP homolog [Mytilus californianus]XP_052063586.1 protein LLP homolog [Mytilus californianus]
MAKSIRSKHKRKMRAIKRERYGKKELETLKKTVTTDVASAIKEEDMKEMFTVRKGSDVVQEIRDEENMDLDSGKKYNTKTKLDEHGNYPVWMNSRQIKKQKKKNKTQKTKRAGKGKK